MNLEDIIIRPIITEKSMSDAAKGKFTFHVAKNAEKGSIKKAVESAFKVKVLAVATSLVKGKTRKTGKRRAEVTKTPWKKATVTLEAGQKIDLFETA